MYISKPFLHKRFHIMHNMHSRLNIMENTRIKKFLPWKSMWKMLQSVAGRHSFVIWKKKVAVFNPHLVLTYPHKHNIMLSLAQIAPHGWWFERAKPSFYYDD